MLVGGEHIECSSAPKQWERSKHILFETSLPHDVKVTFKSLQVDFNIAYVDHCACSVSLSLQSLLVNYSF